MVWPKDGSKRGVKSGWAKTPRVGGKSVEEDSGAFWHTASSRVWKLEPHQWHFSTRVTMCPCIVIFGTPF